MKKEVLSYYVSDSWINDCTVDFTAPSEPKKPPVLTKLEYAAIMAMNGILSNVGMSDEYSVLAYDAIACAKELLKQLEEK